MTPSRPPDAARVAHDPAHERLRPVPVAGSPPSTHRAEPFAVRLTGDVDLVTAPQLERLAEEFRASGCASVSVDLRAVTFIDTAGLAFLARIRVIALERGGTVTVLGAAGICLRTLTLVGFDTSFDLVA